jgi:hypothetical protein
MFTPSFDTGVQKRKQQTGGIEFHTSASVYAAPVTVRIACDTKLDTTLGSLIV